VFAPFPVDLIDVIAIPRLTLLFFGIRLLRFGACAAAKACHEESKNADDFQAGGYVFLCVSYLSRSPKMAQRQAFRSSTRRSDTSREMVERWTLKNSATSL
jgi:hypothetical protein